jgi:hypothetical protein
MRCAATTLMDARETGGTVATIEGQCELTARHYSKMHEVSERYEQDSVLQVTVFRWVDAPRSEALNLLSARG